MALIFSVTPPPSSRARLEKTSFPEFSKLEDAPEESGFVVPAKGDVINANWLETATSTDMAVLLLALAGVSLVGSFCVCIAACTALVTVAVIEAVRASILMLVLGGPVVALNVGGTGWARLGQPCVALLVGHLREDIALQKVYYSTAPK